VHAVGSVVSRYLFEAVSPGARPPDLEQHYAEVRALTARAWRRAAADPHPENLFEILDDDALLGLLFTEEDRLPRPVRD